MRGDLEKRLARLAPKRTQRTERYVFVAGPSQEECDAEIDRLKFSGEASERNVFIQELRAGPTESNIVDFPAGTTAQMLRDIAANETGRPIVEAS